MGRRKIEIKAIKDDRNRSVTFLKRKGGLFKKAYELSVLCQVDVAVIIFGHNKKLYEFSSGDINEAIGRYQYYGGAHEHKGPEDFRDKKDGGSDEEDEEVEEMPRESGSPPHGPTMAHHLHGQPQFNHMGSASPPMPNGAFPHRGPSPQPPHNISRPGSRAHIRQQSTHLMPPQHQGHMQVSQPPPQPQQNYAYMPNPPIYNPQAAAGMQQQRPPSGQPMPPQFPPQFAQQPGQPHPGQQQHPGQHPGQHPQAQHPQIQQIYAQEQQRRSVPPQFQQQHPPPPPPPSQQQPPQNQEQQRPQPSPQPPQNQFSSPPLPQPKPLPAAAKTHSIFTPIDDSRSLIAQHWGSTRDDPPRSDPPQRSDDQRSQSIDVAAMHRSAAASNGIHAPPISHVNTSQQPGPPQRTASTPVIPSIHTSHPPSRANSLQSKPRGPKLTVQIPNEDEEDDSTNKGTTAATSSPQATAAATRTPIDGRPTGGGMVLPPPSPSASALLSAGASGPPNPFARPAPPTGVNGFASTSRSNDIETPISALPSRFVSDQLLPSPSSFYADWFSGRDNNMLPSPLAFPTPVAPKGAGFEEDERKRKLDDAGAGATPEKRLKT